MEQVEKIDEIVFDEVYVVQVIELGIGKVQGVQLVDFCVNFVNEWYQIDVCVVVFEVVFNVCIGKVMQYYLYYCEFVQIGIEQ